MTTRISVTVDFDATATISRPSADYPEQIRIWGETCVALFYVRTADAARKLAEQLLESARLHDARDARQNADQTVRRTCDWCDKPIIGGAAGGGLPSQRWCADHEPDPTEIAYGSTADQATA